MKKFFCIAMCCFFSFCSVHVYSFSGKHHKKVSLSKKDRKWIHAFPMKNYKICTVPSLGSFYIDTPKDCIKGVLMSGLPWEPQFQKIFSSYIKPGSVVLDIGAHIGTHTVTMSKIVGKKGFVYAFEPQKKIFRELFMNLSLNKCTNTNPIHCALGKSSCTMKINLSNPGNEGGASIAIDGTEKVLVRSLDSFGFRHVSFIKIDVENFEDAVLCGARKTITKNHPVIFIEIQGNIEVATALGVDRLSRTKSTIKKIRSLGYKVHHIGGADFLAIPKNEKKC